MNHQTSTYECRVINMSIFRSCGAERRRSTGRRWSSADTKSTWSRRSKSCTKGKCTFWLGSWTIWSSISNRRLPPRNERVSESKGLLVRHFVTCFDGCREIQALPAQVEEGIGLDNQLSLGFPTQTDGEAHSWSQESWRLNQPEQSPWYSDWPLESHCAWVYWFYLPGQREN